MTTQMSAGLTTDYEFWNNVQPIRYTYRATVQIEGSRYTRDYRITAYCEEEARDLAAQYGEVISIRLVY